MSLNLISSLSFLKNKLGVKHEIKTKSSKIDLYAGITESDLDSSSSESEDSSPDSSQCPSPSTGYNTPDTRLKPGPTADILQKCLDILNSDISDSETLPQPDIVKEPNKSLKPETQESDEKKAVRTLPQFSQGLLKIASPRREQEYSSSKTYKSGSCKDTNFQPLSVNVTSSGAQSKGACSNSERGGSPSPELGRISENSSDSFEYPGPPELELMVSLVTTSVPATVTTTQAKPISSSVQFNSQSFAQTKSIQSVTVSANSLIPPENGNQVQQILLPPVPAGQAQQIIIQPSHNINQQQQHIIQQQQSFLGPNYPLVQIVQSGIPLQLMGSPISLLSAGGQFLGTLGGVNNQGTLLNNLQSFTALLQQNQQNNSVSNPAQLNFQQIPNNGMVPVLQQGQFTQNLQNNLVSQPKLLNAITIKQEPIRNNIVTPQLVSFPTASSGNLTNYAPSYQIQGSLPSSTPIIFSSNHQNLLQNVPIPQFQASSCSLPQFQTSSCSVPQVQATNCSISQLQSCSSSSVNLTPIFSNPMSALSTVTSQPSLISQTPVVSQPPAGSQTPVSSSNINVVSTSSSGSSPMAQLVQDPVTGLYNLITTPAPVSTPLLYPSATSTPFSCPTPTPNLRCTPTPLPPGTPGLVPGSPKRSGTPLSNSPSKQAKLLLPSLASSKENRPVVETPPTKFMCGVCNKFFGNTKNLRVHISEIHEGKRGQFPCDVCNKVFPRKRNMERHKNALHLKNNPVCPLCQKVVVNIDVHVKRFHRGSQDFKKESAATA